MTHPADVRHRWEVRERKHKIQAAKRRQERHGCVATRIGALKARVMAMKPDERLWR